MPRRVEDIITSSGRRSIKRVSESETEHVSSRTSARAEKKATREVPLHKEKEVEKETRTKERDEEVVSPKKSTRKKPSKGSSKIWIWSSAGVVGVIVIVAYIASVYFSRATFTIVPVTIPVSVTGTTIVATGTSSPGYLRYETIKAVASSSASVVAVDGPYTSTKASGSVTVYNSFANTPQRLIAGTRFTTDTGLIYRLGSSIIIPGYTTKGSTITPGSIVATLVADQAGSQYNLSKAVNTSPLKIISYTGGPRYDTIYGTLKTDISGGFAGKKKTIDPLALASTTKNLQEYLRMSLHEKVKGLVPDGSIMYDNAYTIAYSNPTIGGTVSNTATVSVTATMYGVIFKRTDLVTKLAGPQKMQSLVNATYMTKGLESLQFTITNGSNFAPAKNSALIAKLSGNMTIVGVVPVDTLKQQLAGLSLSETRNIIAAYSSVIDVSHSSGELFPSWATRVPSNQERIHVVLKDH